MDALSIDESAAIGGALRRAREAAGLSRNKLAAMVGVDPATIQRYEKGWIKIYGHRRINLIPAPMLHLIATRLGTTAASVLTDAGLPATALPSIPPRDEMEAAVQSRIEDAERVSLRVDAGKQIWEDFVSSLEGEAKDRFIQLLTSGNVQAIPTQ